MKEDKKLAEIILNKENEVVLDIKDFKKIEYVLEAGLQCFEFAKFIMEKASPTKKKMSLKDFINNINNFLFVK